MTASGAERTAFAARLRIRAYSMIALIWIVAAGVMQWQKTCALDASGIQRWLARSELKTLPPRQRAEIPVALGRAFCRLRGTERVRLIESGEFERTLRAMTAGELRAFHELAVPAGVCGVLLDAGMRPESERRAAFAQSVRRARTRLSLEDERVSRETVRALVERGLAAFNAVAGAEHRLAAVPLVDRLRDMLGFL